jgi:spore germination cell wall hydrolase CwlJ-like protein
MKLEILKGLVIFIVVMAALGTWIYVGGSSGEAEATITETTDPSSFTQPTETIKMTQPTTAPAVPATAPSTESTSAPTEPPKTEEENFEEKWSESAIYLAKTIWGEARGCSELEQRKVVWCILNRVDSPRFHNTIIEVITAETQFHGYSYSNPIIDEYYQMALDIISLWLREKQGEQIVRDLDKKYLFFSSNSTGTGHNFRTEY